MSPSADKRNHSHVDFAMRSIHIGNNTEIQWEGLHNRLKRAVRQPYSQRLSENAHMQGLRNPEE